MLLNHNGMERFNIDGLVKSQKRRHCEGREAILWFASIRHNVGANNYSPLLRHDLPRNDSSGDFL